MADADQMKTTSLAALTSLALIYGAPAHGQTLDWMRQLGTSSDDVSLGVSADGLGNVYISGATKGSLDGTNAGGDDVFIGKYNASGTLQWTRQLGTNKLERSWGVSADGLGNVYISGETWGDLEGTNPGKRDAFVAKFSIEGSPTPGDANGDGEVNGTDYFIWADNYGDDPADDPPARPPTATITSTGWSTASTTSPGASILAKGRTTRPPCRSRGRW